MLTMPVLLSCSLALWLFVTIAGDACEDAILGDDVSSNVWTRIVALVCYFSSAFILNSIHLFERRVGWLFSLFMWLAIQALFVQHRYDVALSVLVLVSSFSILFSCQLAVDVERRFFMVFAFLGSSVFFMPALILLLPIYVVFAYISNILTVKRFLAMQLGLVTPFWLAFGLAYVYDPAGILFSCMKSFFCGLALFAFLPESHVLLFMAAELLVLVPAIVLLFGPLSSGKPLLMRRILFFLLLNVYCLFLSFMVPSRCELFYACSIPGTAVLASYIFTSKITKLSNIYFIFVNLIWIILAFYCLWMELF